jgi:hypothetical protein
LVGGAVGARSGDHPVPTPSLSPHLQAQLEADVEQEEHDAQLGQVAHAGDVFDDAQRVWADGGAAHQKAGRVL